jgi:Myc proto-oncogene protein
VISKWSTQTLYFDLFVAEDEIDVVSIIEKPVKRKCPPPLPCNKNINNLSNTLRQCDQPAAKRPKMNQKRPRESTNKDTRESSPEPDQDPSDQLSGKEKFEDPECKRNVHNVLERKRRNDLKYSFQVLRDSIPDLKGSERAPKVAILRKATDCILNLRSEQERLLEQKSLLERTHQSLKQKLKALTESS